MPNARTHKGVSDGVDLATLSVGGMRAGADAFDSAQSAKMEAATPGLLPCSSNLPRKHIAIFAHGFSSAELVAADQATGGGMHGGCGTRRLLQLAPLRQMASARCRSAT